MPPLSLGSALSGPSTRAGGSSYIPFLQSHIAFATTQQSRGFANIMWNIPNVRSNPRKYKGISVTQNSGQYTGRQFTTGYPHPKKADPDKPRKVPHRGAKIHSGDFTLARMSDDTFLWTPPYPPRVTPRVEPYPKLSKSKWYKNGPPEYFPLRWKNIEYKLKWHIKRKPFGKEPWHMELERIDHGEKPCSDLSTG